MKLNVDDDVLRIYAQLPHEFRRSDVLAVLVRNGIHYDPNKVSYQLQLMEEAKMVERISSRKYNKRYDNLESWWKKRLHELGVSN